MLVALRAPEDGADRVCRQSPTRELIVCFFSLLPVAPVARSQLLGSAESESLHAVVKSKLAWRSVGAAVWGADFRPMTLVCGRGATIYIYLRRQPEKNKETDKKGRLE